MLWICTNDGYRHLYVCSVCSGITQLSRYDQENMGWNLLEKKTLKSWSESKSNFEYPQVGMLSCDGKPTCKAKTINDEKWKVNQSEVWKCTIRNYVATTTLEYEIQIHCTCWWTPTDGTVWWGHLELETATIGRVNHEYQIKARLSDLFINI